MKITPFDSSKFFTSKAAQNELLKDAFESGDSRYIAHALGVIARAKGMTDISQKTGLTRESLYRSLSKKGDPRLSTLMGIVHALGLELRIQHQKHVDH
ncbi:addiction module antidote protein [Bartonella queenslandensis]|uniref:addiction module antidote protein n=1 Tax=Bartonella queenslandensis TaxID=481138 RepID=UPI000315F8B7|nr:addiction module antidote protein [Bartonella queenslandensis]